MTRDGAVAENLTTGETSSISERPQEENYSAPAGVAAEKVVQHIGAEIERHAAKGAEKKALDATQPKTHSSRLQFSEAERATPELQKAIKKSDKAADCLDAARAAIPKQTKIKKERVFDEAKGKAKTRLSFEKTDKPPNGKLRHNPLSRPAQELNSTVHGKIYEVEKENVGVESGHRVELAGEKAGGMAARAVKGGIRRHKLKPYRAAAAAEKQAVKANADFLYQKALHDNPALAHSNPISRFWQKQRIKKQYAKTLKAGGKAKKTAEATAKAAKKTAQETKRATFFVVRHWKGCLIVGGIAFIVLLLFGGLSSCSLFGGNSGSGLIASSYLSEDADITGAESAYAAMEAELQDMLDNIESEYPGYDEYRVNADEIEHDPYVLISILSAWHEGVFTLDEVQSTLEMLFEKQYILTVEEEVQVRYRTETRTDSEGNPYTVEVPYNYYILHVDLENFNLSHVPVYIMGEEQLSMYAMHRSDVTEIINACDSGREGELIFRFVYEQANCKKPFSRLWISSMEASAIREGFSNLKDGRGYDNLYQSALCRAKADWLIGINATRLFSILYHKTLNVGRVQTPTLAMLVNRDYAISSFKKEKYHVVRLDVGGVAALSERQDDEAAARQMKAACEKSQAVCTSLKKEKKTAAPPKLFDLTALQREANRLYGFTAKQTLDYAQALYEKRLLTYPRTDSKYITSDMEGSTKELITGLCAALPFMQGVKLQADLARICDNSKVTDHHAILPTAEFVKTGFSSLAESEKKLMTLVCAKLLCAVAAPYEYEAVTAVFTCGGYTFTAKGRTTLCEGWREIERLSRAASGEQDEDAEPEAVLPPLAEGQTFDNPAAEISERYTQPPKAFTEDTLLSAMESAGKEDTPEDAERKGLGTTATRAGIIEKLISAGFAERKGKKLIPTKDGYNLVAILPDSLTSPQLTAEWETRLTGIAKGSDSPADFMRGIEEMTAGLVKTYSAISEDKAKLFTPQREAIGTCPRCGAAVYEGKKNFYCSDRACSFVMWKNDRFFEQRKKAFTKAIAAALLKDGKVKIKGMYSTKTGKTFDGVVLLADTGGKYVNFRVEQNRK